MLTERQLFLLQVLVDDYIRSAEPVGSRAISKRDDVHYSSATIRNELADLEDMGFLEKTHSSSGRIPSEKGYRFYVDHLLSPVMISAPEMNKIKTAFTEKYLGLEKLIQVTAEMLSNFTSYTTIVMGPELLDTKLKHIQIIHLNDDRAVMIVVTDTGHVENRMISLPPGINEQDIEKLVNILNEKLKMVPLYQLNQKIEQEVKNVLRKNISSYNQVMTILEKTLNVDSPDKIFYGGKNNILSQPEFQDIDKVLPLLNIFEKKEIIHDLLRTPSAGLHIKIGKENDLVAIKDCSVITTTYSVSGEHCGTVAVIGPTRMAYPRVVTLMDIFSNSLSAILNERD
ncbi:heat-inducible transcription repressor HrcA [Scopulibacillus darangshiensis]|uniref:Heat-inducible transcription repressor HrcA n=1 Tax=Scopulibacillus darangshiensis TaxID=442528 RepID=A0A4R2PBC3_9BACL|nr:heat-inducible transcriptional repressor HrcA [Scopulibacillus darangshiensis]TCP32332.1 heat-inducible transcription repressor HrcA [Scopulibacillus darangshiensis]